jgi:hypothetical protein
MKVTANGNLALYGLLTLLISWYGYVSAGSEGKREPKSRAR